VIPKHSSEVLDIGCRSPKRTATEMLPLRHSKRTDAEDTSVRHYNLTSLHIRKVIKIEALTKIHE
jgi:hypothetical protein